MFDATHTGVYIRGTRTAYFTRVGQYGDQLFLEIGMPPPANHPDFEQFAKNLEWGIELMQSLQKPRPLFSFS